MILFALTLVFVWLTIVFTATTCHLIARWGGRAGWYVTFVGALGAAFAGTFITMRTELGDVVIPDDPKWGHYTFTARDELTLFWILAGAAIIPASLAVRDYRRRRAGKSASRMVVSIALTAAIAAVSLHYQQREWYRCRTCFADRIVTQWRLGSWPRFSVPLSTRLEKTTQSHFGRDFLSSDHMHDWVLAHNSCYHFFGTTWNGDARGNGRWVTLFCDSYEHDSRFRMLIQAKLENGSFAKSNLVATFWLPPRDTPFPISHQEQVLLDELILGRVQPQKLNK